MKKKQKRSSKKRYDVIRPKSTDNKPLRTSKEPKKELKPEVPTIKKRTQLRLLKEFKKLFASVVFGRLYAMLAVAMLAATTLLWSLMGAKLQGNNADQLVDPYLFQHHDIFQGALFPGAHTFLLKWPLFWLVKLLGYTDSAYIGVTVVTVLVTVGLLAALLYKIERRPAVFGTLCLALSSVLLLVPIVPYPGALLPVNMAMLATRNLEYVLYIVGLALVIRSPKVASKRFWLGAACLLLLAASDKFFLAIGLVAAGMALFVYALRQRSYLVNIASHWLLAILVASVGAVGLLALLNVGGVTNVTGGSDGSPYGLVHGSHALLLGLVYGVLGLLTNFGANPAYDATVLRDIPHRLADRLFGLTGSAYTVNLLLLLAGLFAAWKLLRHSWRPVKPHERPTDTATNLSIALLLSALAACGLFVVTTHYYAVDARYLTLAVFALFVAAATYARQHVWRRNHVVIAGVLILASSFVAVPAAINGYNDDRTALDDVNQRNELVLQAISHHKVSTLVGDYWRVIPTRQASPHQALKVLPLADCTQTRDTLSSKAWEVNLHKDSFAYLLSFDKSLTDYPACSFNQVTAVYGHPSSSLLIAGTFSQPEEELLFYDHGMSGSGHSTAQSPSQTLTSILPISLRQLPDLNCDGLTIMNVVAHQDDDLLFTSPDLLNDVTAGHCVRSIYVTAGDAGYGQFYWLSRQQGSEAAYSSMLGFDHGWVQRVVKLSDSAYVTVASPRGNNKIQLVFMNLPDGNTTGGGFAASKFESLAKLEAGKIHVIRAVDHQSSYTSAQLNDALITLMKAFKPTEIRTQATRNLSDTYPDHSDHLAVGRYTQAAYGQYLATESLSPDQTSIYYYIGYPIHELESNVTGPELSQKEAAFFAYAKHDGGVCNSVQNCQEESSAYSYYLSRQYQQADE